MTDHTPQVRPLDREREISTLVPLDRLVNGDRPAGEIEESYRGYRGRILVAQAGDRIVAYATLSYPYWNRVAMMDHLAVEEEWRRRGVGRLLCAAVDDRARSLGARIVAVQTALWNYEAVRFYACVGYRPRGVFAEYLGEGNDLVWLDKGL